ncbi:MAG: hypothetical protein PSX71_00595 [bacterium]|nr:hypothetical protein [bacterium]
MRLTAVALSLLSLSALPVTAMACSSCGCTLSSDWVSQGMSSKPGMSVDLRYDFIDQTALRSGTRSAMAPVVPGADEVEQRSTNRYTTLTLGYNINKAWGVSLLLPYLDRSHSTIAPGDSDISTSHTRSPGDIKLVGRYQGFSDDGDTGLLFGVKLPTGRDDFLFNGGPQQGELLDRSLQPGSGSTDLLLGGFRFGSLNRDWDWYAQALAQAAVRTHDDFRPGNVYTANGGLRYMSLDRVTPLLQLNALERRADGGANADAVNSGGRSLYVSPGISVNLGKNLNVYSFVQAPLYQQVNGLQLAPRWNASVGLSFSLR